MTTSSAFQGPGQWRSQAESARHADSNIFVQLADMIRLMSDAGLDASPVVEAARVAKTGDTERASQLLRQAARDVGAARPGYALGLTGLADRLPLPGKEPASGDDEIPGVTPAG
jgi:hypothetical protein